MMSDWMRPILELAVVIPAAVLCLLPMGGHLRKGGKRLIILGIPGLALWAVLGGLLCYARRWDANMLLPVSLILFAAALLAAVDLPFWKTISVFLGVCGVFSCLTNLATAADAALSPDNAGPWFMPAGGVIFNLLCWGFVALAAYPSTHAVRRFLFELEMPGTWYVFWILPTSFTVLNIFILPRDYHTLYAGRMRLLYPLIVGILLGLLVLCYLMFYLMARRMGENMRLHQQNQFLQMQTAQYEALQSAISETKQARHDLRHHFTAIDALIRRQAWEELRAYVEAATERIPDSELNLCDNPAADGVAGHYAVQYRREGIPFRCLLDLPRRLPVSEMDVCLVLSNLLENALEASLRLPPRDRQISVQGELHGDNLVLLEVENTYTGEIVEENGAFRSTKRRGMGVGLQSVRRIAEQSGGYCKFEYGGGVFRAYVMLRGSREDKECEKQLG